MLEILWGAGRTITGSAPSAIAASVAAGVLLCASPPARAELPTVAEPARWSVGFMLGAPTGLSAKRYLGGRDAVDVNAAFAFAPGLRFSADYLFGLAKLPSESANVGLNLYLGVGPVVGAYSGPCGVLSDNRCGNGAVYAGARIPFGVEAVFRRTPLATGFELAPGLVGTSGGAAGILDLLLTVRLLL